MTAKQRRRAQKRVRQGKTPAQPMLDPAWTPEKGYSHAHNLIRRLFA